jgi:prepilin-type N-terminal cleavage/methylation domain-containing protein
MRALHRRSALREESGFSLMEVMVALGLMAIVMSAAGMLFIRSLSSGKQQEQRQVASGLADQGLEIVRAHDPQTILNGRTQSQIDAQWASPGPINLTQSNKPTAVGSGAAVIPTTPTTYVVAGTTYSVNTIIGTCYVPATGSSSSPGASACVKTSTTGAALLYRVSVSVTWAAGHGAGCQVGLGVCSVVSDTLISPSGDPMFNNNP